MLLGIDLGTSSVKVVALDARGGVRAQASRSYPLATPRPGWVEQNPEDWFEATAAAVREVAQQVSGDAVRAVGLSGQMHTLVLSGRDGAPVRPAISWADTRSVEQVRAFEASIDARARLSVLGNPCVTGFTGTSLLWVREHEPAAYAAAERVMLAKDYLRARLVDDWATDASDASATLLFDPYQRRWASEVTDALEIDPALLPPLRPSDGIAGTLTRAAAARLGLREGTPVMTGAGDQAAAACGCGLTEPGTMLVTLGSGGQVFAPLSAPRADPKLRVHLFCHAVPARWHLLGAVQNLGLALDWVRRTCGWSWPELYARAEQAPPGAGGLTFVPYLTGERTPHMDPHARASWQGLTLAHGAEHLARAAVEGTVFAIAEAVQACFEAGAAADVIALAGGGAEAPLPRRILADVLDRPLRRAQVHDASAKGAAVLAAGVDADYAGAIPAALASEEAEAPGPQSAPHRDAFERYRGASRP